MLQRKKFPTFPPYVTKVVTFFLTSAKALAHIITSILQKTRLKSVLSSQSYVSFYKSVRLCPNTQNHVKLVLYNVKPIRPTLHLIFLKSPWSLTSNHTRTTPNKTCAHNARTTYRRSHNLSV